MPVFVYCLHVCTLFIKTHYSAINLILKTSETRVCVCVCVYLSSRPLCWRRRWAEDCWPLNTQQRLWAASETSSPPDETADTHAHTHTHTRLVHQGAPRFWRSNTESSEIHFYWGDINTVWSQQSDCCSSHSELRGQRSEVRGQTPLGWLKLLRCLLHVGSLMSPGRAEEYWLMDSVVKNLSINLKSQLDPNKQAVLYFTESISQSVNQSIN